MKLIAGILLAGTLLSAQTPHKSHCPYVPENIPHDAVQPQYHKDDGTSTPYCPRNEYELKWFVIENSEVVLPTNTIPYPYYSNGQSSLSYKSVLTFTPYCILKEDQ